MEQITPVQSNPAVDLKDLFARRGELTLNLAILQNELQKVDTLLQQAGVPFTK